jgi:hypothetical protein
MNNTHEENMIVDYTDSAFLLKNNSLEKNLLKTIGGVWSKKLKAWVFDISKKVEVETLIRETNEMDIVFISCPSCDLGRWITRSRVCYELKVCVDLIEPTCSTAVREVTDPKKNKS